MARIELLLPITCVTSPERHAHGKDARSDRAVVGNLVAEDRAGGSVHDEPDVAFDTADFDIGLIGGEDG